MYEFEMYGISHTIVRLPIHLPNKKIVYFKEGNENEAIDKAKVKASML